MGSTEYQRDHRHVVTAGAASGAAPDTVDYLVGTASGDLSAEIVAGTSPGGELGGTWASPTVDATHSGSAHSAYQPLDADLTAIAALTSAADKAPYSTGAQAWALADLTAAGRALIDDATAAAQATTLGLGTGNTPAFTGIAVNTVAFPATQVPSANANTLDDYEEGTWTPDLTFATPGDLSVVTSTNEGWYRKVGNVVFWECSIVTSTFTYTTSTGIAKVTGLPFTQAGNAQGYGEVIGYVVAGATITIVTTGTELNFYAWGSGLAESYPQAGATWPTAVQKRLRLSGFYRV